HGGAFKEFIVHRTSQILVHLELSGLQLVEQRGVLFINHFVAGEVLAAQGERFLERRAPHFQCLARNREHQIQIDVVESGSTQNIERLENHVASMNAAQSVEQIAIERLYTH